MATLLFALVGSMGMQAGITLAAYHLVSVVLLGQPVERGLDDTVPQLKNQVQCGLFLDIIV